LNQSASKVEPINPKVDPIKPKVDPDNPKVDPTNPKADPKVIARTAEYDSQIGPYIGPYRAL
jgi:hypothetical protein